LKIKEVKNLHPCFNMGNNKGRMHLPVCPACNIMCKFCERRIGGERDEIRPGLAAALISPEKAGDYVAKALQLCPEITVVGIAGPGDTLATDHALRAFKSIHERFPELIKCMSTNGLLLAERIDEVVKARINTLTVTVNAVNPAILNRLCDGICYHGRLYEGEEAGLMLIRNQIEGIRLAAKAGIIVKVNAVLAPEINGRHIQNIAKTVARAGADIFNIIPLIPQGRLGDQKAPGCEELDRARRAAEQYMPVFRHCQHCRADAVGRLGGSDLGGQLYSERVEDTFSHG
jgi:nitrogen fixation protein NifB